MELSAQFAGTQQTPFHRTGATVVHNETGRMGKVTAQHQNRQVVNVAWKPGDVTVERVHELRGAGS
jgi:hypothetical protein